MADGDNSVLGDIRDRLVRIEAKAETYLTKYGFGTWVALTVLVVVGGFFTISETHKSELKDDFDAAITRAEKNIASATEEALKLDRGAIVKLISAQLGNGTAIGPWGPAQVSGLSGSPYLALNNEGVLLAGSKLKGVDTWYVSKEDKSTVLDKFESLKGVHLTNQPLTSTQIDDYLAALSEEISAEFLEEAGAIPVDLDLLYVRNPDGTFRQAFPPLELEDN